MGVESSTRDREDFEDTDRIEQGIVVVLWCMTMYNE